MATWIEFEEIPLRMFGHTLESTYITGDAEIDDGRVTCISLQTETNIHNNDEPHMIVPVDSAMFRALAHSIEMACAARIDEIALAGTRLRFDERRQKMGARA